MMKPLISIIVPVYNAEMTLARCMDSVLAQSFRAFEVILIDDGSRDGSGALCDRYCAVDSRIRVIHQENAGVSAARNAGIRLAEGDYLLFLDSDDALEAEALCRYAEAAENHSYDVVIGSLAVIEEGVRSRKIGVEHELCAGNEIWERICLGPAIFGYAGGKMICTKLVQSHGLEFNRGMRSQEDMDFFLSVYGLCSRFRMLPETVYQYYYTPTSRTPPTWDFISNQMKMLRIGKTRTALSEEAQDCVQKRIVSLLYTGLYDASAREDFGDVVQRIAEVEGLLPLLQDVSATGEHGFVVRSFAAGKYRRIRRYFRLRNGIRDAVRIIRKRKPE